MTTAHPDGTRSSQPLRLWPGVVIAAIVVFVRFVVPIVMPEATMVGVLGAMAGAVAMLIWWLGFSRAPWSERLAAVAVMVLAVIAVKPLTHRSISTGMMGTMFFVYGAPVSIVVSIIVFAIAARRLSRPLLFATLVATTLATFGAWTLVRTDGVMGDGRAQLAWRWTKTSEQRLLEQSNDVVLPASRRTEPVAPAVPPITESPKKESPASPERPAPSPVAPAAPVPSAAATTSSARGPEWPGFRGTERDGIVRGVRIETDWTKAPPSEMWRRPVGPGWSSFAVRGDVFYTQEQRGDLEVVACYRVSTGEPVWRHTDAVRFWESNGGAGPRGTPTLHEDRVYALGATGILNVLDAGNGAVVWSRNISSDADKRVPGWGFASSPLIVDDLVVVAAAGKLVAYERATGKPRWFGPNGGGGYSSPHLATIGGVRQILFLSGAGAIGVAPSTGQPLWEHAWSGTPIVQPALTADGDILITTGDAMGGVGLRRIAVVNKGDQWSVEERWTSRGLKPYFNDLVIHNGHAFGFDGRILSCVDVADGQRKWKGGRYGQGQLVLLADQDVLLILSEDGELALVGATADGFRELSRVPGIEGKTWNHPVLFGNVLLVRNGEEMAAFRLARVDGLTLVH